MSLQLFSERLRVPYVLLGVGLAAALVLAWGQRSSRVERAFEACVDAPASCDGQERVLNLHRVEGVARDRYWLLGRQRDIEVRGPVRALQVGQTLTVGVRVDAELGLVERWRVRHSRREAKYLLGVVGLLFLVLALPFWFRWRRGRLVIRG